MSILGFLLYIFLPSLPPTLAAIAALVSSIRNGRSVAENTAKMTEIHIILNGRLAELLQTRQELGQAQGRQIERDATAPTPPPA